QTTGSRGQSRKARLRSRFIDIQNTYRAVGREGERLSCDVSRQHSRQSEGRRFSCDRSRQHSIESNEFFLNVYTLTKLDAPPFFIKLMVTDACFSLSRRR